VVPTPPPIAPAKPKNALVTVLIVIIVLLSLGTAGFFAYNTYQRAHQVAPTPTPTPIPLVSPEPTAEAADPTADWKTFTLNEIIFKYPPDWTNPEYIQTPSGQSVEIKNNDNTQRIVVISGINKGYTKADLSGFINSLIENGAKKLTLDGSEAAESTLTSQGSKITTVYVTSKDKTSQYSIALQTPEAYPDQEMDKLLNQILSTFTFIEPSTTYTCPQSGWVDCMPGPDEKPECSPAAMSWYQANCPGFKGGAL
jgi:hypothetical protein